MTNVSSATAESQVLNLTVTAPDGGDLKYQVDDGASLIVGTGQNCGLQLRGDDISPIHCVIRYHDNAVAVQDWCSKSGTFVGGNQIADEVSVAPGVELRVGGYRIATSPANGFGGAAVAPSEPILAENVSSPVATDYAAAQAETVSGLTDVTPTPETQPQFNSSAQSDESPSSNKPAGAQVELESARAFGWTDSTPPEPEGDSHRVDTKSLESSPPAGGKSDSAAECPDQPQEKPAAEPVAETQPAPDPQPAPESKALEPKRNAEKAPRAPRRPPLTPEQSFNQETIELLQSELEFLQSELADRDSRILEMNSLLDDGSVAEPPVDNSETEALVGRLEELLDELDRSDKRIHALEELLLAAQDTSRAEIEEREQVERWLGDIERRVTDRESEWQAERDILTARVEELRDRLDEADRQIEESATASSPESLRESSLQNLREQNDQLHEQLNEAREEQRRLETRLADVEGKSAAENQEEKIEAALREERLKLAQERAEVSRERAEFTRRATENPDKTPESAAATADQRFNAFRQTLRELHAQEHQVVAKPSLGSRIADLWKRLDGPTDTD